MKKTIIVTASILIFFYGHLFAEEKKSAKSKVLIYNFQFLKTPVQKSEKHKKQQDYRYYSYIIPETISKRIKETQKCSIIRKNKSLFSGKRESLDEITQNYTPIFENDTKTASTDFIISGIYEIFDNTLHVKAYIYDSTTKEIQEISAESRETGIFLKETTDTLAERIDAKLKHPVKTEIAEKDDSEKSPFLILATPLLYTTFGIDVGYLYPQGKWKDVYNKTIYYAPYLTFDIAKYLELSVKYDYFQTDTEDMETSTYFKARVMGGAASLGLRFPLFSNFLICLSAGVGMSRSEIIVKPDKPFIEELANEKSTDPSAEAGISLKLKLSAIQLKTGALYKRFFLNEEKMDTTVFFGGIGTHF